MKPAFRLLVALSIVASVVPQRSYVDIYEEMVVAFRGGDHEAMAAAAEEALELRPRFPSMMVNLALARTLLGETDAALDLLDGVASMGLTYPVADMEQFAPLADTPRFAQIVARMEANALPEGAAEVAFTLEPRDFFPEGIAADPETGDVFVSSVRTGDVTRVGSGGAASLFANLAWAAMGMRVDRQRSLLWVSISGVSQRRDLPAANAGRAGIAAVDLDTGLPMSEYLLPEGVDRVVGDLVIGDDGSVYATDSIAGGLWVLRPGTDSMTPVLRDGTLASPQGLDFGADGTLYVAAYNGGIYRVGAGGQATAVTVPDDVSVYGIDGLYAAENALIVVQNGITPNRVVRLQLDDAGAAVTGATVLLSADPRFGEPTLGALADGAMYLVANSPWPYFGDPEQPPATSDLPVPTVLRLPLR